ncbi:MAG TPA: hypothetical protein VM866_00325 [Pyrinomonadaceae bacterium]|nr:hypothetical protein [Pyrinomonadaceae bacterium]
MGKIIIGADGSSGADEFERKVRQLAESVGAQATRAEGRDGAWQVEAPGLPDEDLREMWNEIDVDATDDMS